MFFLIISFFIIVLIFLPRGNKAFKKYLEEKAILQYEPLLRQFSEEGGSKDLESFVCPKIILFFLVVKIFS